MRFSSRAGECSRGSKTRRGSGAAVEHGLRDTNLSTEVDTLVGLWITQFSHMQYGDSFYKLHPKDRAALPAKPLVISYKRFSSKKQERGDSLARQTASAVAWCKANEMELDTSMVFEDLGVSGYSGANLNKGALFGLKQMADTGKLPQGTVILVEAFDRLTRLPINYAQELLLGLTNNGMTVVTLTDAKVWNARTMQKFETFMFSLMSLYRGFQESDYKSWRLASTFKDARVNGIVGKFSSCPGWLYRDKKHGPWLIREAESKSVIKIYELAAEGLGCKDISVRANLEKWPKPYRTSTQKDGGWTVEYVRKILQTRSVLGEHEHLRYAAEEEDGERGKPGHGIPTGIVRTDYYPAIISEELWLSARAALKPAGVSRPKKVDPGYLNIWRGLLYCGHCGAPLHRRHELRRGGGEGQLMCSARLAGLSDCKSMSFKQFDPFVLDGVYKLVTESLGDSSGNDMLAKLARIDAAIEDCHKRLSRIAEAVEKSGGLATFIAQAKKLEDDIKRLEEERANAAVSQMAASTASVFDTTFVETAMKNLYDLDSEQAVVARANLHLKIARTIDEIYVYPYDCAVIVAKGSRMTLPIQLPRGYGRARSAGGAYPLAINGHLVLPEKRNAAGVTNNSSQKESENETGRSALLRH